MYASVDGLSNNAQLLLSSGAQTDLQNKVEQCIITFHYHSQFTNKMQLTRGSTKD